MENLATPAPARLAPYELYEYAVAGRAIAGERQSGDAALVQATADGALVALIDGLGHGPEAAEAAQLAVGTLRRHAGAPLLELLQRCHQALLATRGAAIAVAALNVADSAAAADAELAWCGVGNVEAVLLPGAKNPKRSGQWLTNAGGVVGYQMPVPQARVTPIFPGDLLIMASDGVDDRFAANVPRHASPEHLVRCILDRYGKASDDALVLVLRWHGAAGNKHRFGEAE